VHNLEQLTELPLFLSMSVLG